MAEQTVGKPKHHDAEHEQNGTTHVEKGCETGKHRIDIVGSDSIDKLLVTSGMMQEVITNSKGASNAHHEECAKEDEGRIEPGQTAEPRATQHKSSHYEELCRRVDQRNEPRNLEMEQVGNVGTITKRMSTKPTNNT